MKKLLLSFSLIALIMGANAQTDLFFSEYIEGSGNNKALEIYNPTDQTIDLSSYYVVRFSNGEAYPANLDPTTTSGGYVKLVGSLAPGECHVLVNGQTETNEFSPACDPALQALADQLDNDYPAPTYMNGNDAIGLMKYDGTNYLAVDIFGQIGMLSTMDNAYGWSYVEDSVITYMDGDVEVTATISDYVVPEKADNGSSFGPFWMAWSKDHTLIRKSHVTQGVTANPNGFDIAAEWDTIGMSVGDTAWTNQDVWSNLGVHGGTSIKADRKTSNSFSIYPNPATNNTFSIVASGHITNVQVFNSIGKLVNVDYNSFATRANVTLNNLSKGIYFVTINVKNDNSPITRKLIVE